MADEIRTLQLERFKLVALARISEEMIKHFANSPTMKLSEHAEFMCDEISAQIVQAVYGLEVKRASHRWPADWWQAFKDRWFPAWALNHWPVKYRMVTLTARELYPFVKAPEKEYKVAIQKTVS